MLPGRLPLPGALCAAGVRDRPESGSGLRNEVTASGPAMLCGAVGAGAFAAEPPPELASKLVGADAAGAPSQPGVDASSAHGGCCWPLDESEYAFARLVIASAAKLESVRPVEVAEFPSPAYEGNAGDCREESWTGQLGPELLWRL